MKWIIIYLVFAAALYGIQKLRGVPRIIVDGTLCMIGFMLLLLFVAFTCDSSARVRFIAVLVDYAYWLQVVHGW